MLNLRQSVLLVDDEPQILVALEDLLCDEFNVYTAGSGEAAMDVMDHESNIAVVITDQRMPDMTGDELLAKLQPTLGTQSILVTGYADLSAVIRAVNDGRIFAYITKPWDAEDLRVKVKQAATLFRVNRELRTERQLLHDLMDSSPDGIFFKDRQLRFRRVNRAFAGFMNLKTPEFLGKRLDQLNVKIPDLEMVGALEQEVLREGRPVLGVLTELESSAGARWISEVRAPVRGPGGEIDGLVGISRDVTAQLELEQQLIQSQKMDAIGRLAGGVAHDFNNLLAVIQSYAELAADGLADEERARDDLQQLLKATGRAAALTKQLLTFSRRQVRTMDTVDVNTVVGDVATMLRRVIDERVSVTVRLSSTPVLVRMDVTELEQVVLNLAINARDAMPSGGELILETSISDRQLHGGPTVMLSTIDNGMGMTPEVRARIFEPFFSTKELGKGTGLGLATVYGIIRQAGGEITVRSEIGQGTRFDVLIPAALEATAPIAAPASTRSVKPPTGGTILLVEDDPAVRRVTTRILEKVGYRVLEAATPSEALDIVTRERVDMLLSDIVMPEMLGTDLYAAIQSSRPGLPALFISGYASVPADGTPIPAGAHFLEKPFTPAALTREVNATLRG